MPRHPWSSKAKLIESHVKRWVEQECINTCNDPKDETLTLVGSLYASWKNWMEVNGLNPGYILIFSSCLNNLGFERHDNSARYFKNVRLKNNDGLFIAVGKGRWRRPGSDINSVLQAYNEIDDVDFREWLSYDPDTGIFRWLKSNGSKAPVGGIAGHKTYYGYIRISVCKLGIFAHRLAWWFCHGKFPEHEIDHINGNKSDNRIANLREATTAQNRANVKPTTRNTSGTKGVHWNNKHQRWHARITVSGKVIWLGQFENKDDAAIARQSAEKIYQKEFAWSGAARFAGQGIVVGTLIAVEDEDVASFAAEGIVIASRAVVESLCEAYRN